MTEAEGQIDPRDLELEGRVGFRRRVSTEMVGKYQGLLVEEVVVADKTAGDGKEDAKRGKKDKKVRINEREFSKGDRERLNELEQELVALLLNEHMRPATERIGIQNENIVPYNDRFTVDVAVEEVVDLKKELERSLGTDASERSVEVLERLDGVQTWMEGNAGLLKGSGPVLVQFFDGWAAMANAVRTQPRYDAMSTDFKKLYSLEDPKKIAKGKGSLNPEWELGKEIISKQDQVYEIMRGVAAANRHRWRNAGKELEETSNKADIYSVTDEQMEFVELFLGHNPRDNEGNETQDVEALSEILMGRDKEEIVRALDRELKRKARRKYVEGKDEDFNAFFEEKRNPTKELIDKWREEFRVYFVEGEEVKITKELIKKWKKNTSALDGKTLLVDGVEWEVKDDTTDAIAEALEYRIGSGDSVFVGERKFADAENHEKVTNKVSDNNEVAILRETPRTINNLYVMDQDPQSVMSTKMLIGAMIEFGVWEQLAEGADLNRIVLDFKKHQETYESNELDEHIIETARIALLYFCEGAELGWGFNYKDEKLKHKEEKNRKGKVIKPEHKTDQIKRYVDSGGTKAATDIGTPFFWLRTEAANEWKEWTSGLLPMDDRIKLQILDHEPGWAPWQDKKKGTWNTVFMGVKMPVGAPTKFPMSMLEVAKFVNAGPELRKKVDDEWEPKRVMDLIKDGKNMSEVPWLKLKNEQSYHWYITLSQLAKNQALLSAIPDRDVARTFFGEVITVPGLAEMLELMKRQSLAYRDMGGNKDVEHFVPLVASLYMAYDMNVLPESNEPGLFYTGQVKRATKARAGALSGLAPKGDKEMAQKMSESFTEYMEQLVEMGKRYARQAAALELGKRPKEYE